MMTIRHARPEELDILMALFESGKRIMRKSGNLLQWTGNYPPKEQIEREIAAGHTYVCIDERGEIVATFAFIPGIDPTYLKIYEGSWVDDTRPYAVIHRLASTEESHGVADAVFHWCYSQLPNLRADTHRDNHILQHILLKQGFRYCGIIYLANGDERLAYQKCSEV